MVEIEALNLQRQCDQPERDGDRNVARQPFLVSRKLPVGAAMIRLQAGQICEMAIARGISEAWVERAALAVDTNQNEPTAMPRKARLIRNTMKSIEGPTIKLERSGRRRRSK